MKDLIYLDAWCYIYGDPDMEGNYTATVSIQVTEEEYEEMLGGYPCQLWIDIPPRECSQIIEDKIRDAIYTEIGDDIEDNYDIIGICYSTHNPPYRIIRVEGEDV